MSFSPSDVMHVMNESHCFSNIVVGSKSSSSLTQQSTWGASVWVQADPSSVQPWLHRAHTESVQYGSTVVCLFPARTNTRYFHDIVLRYASDLFFLRSRLKCKGHNKQAPYASAVAVFQGHSGGVAVHTLDMLRGLPL